MKKIYLLSCTFLLALTGCNEANKGSGSGEPSALTPQEALSWIKEGNYTVDITVSYYDEGGEKDILKDRVKKDEMKFELQDLEGDENAAIYITDKMYDCTLMDEAWCYQIAGTPSEDEEENIWYRTAFDNENDYMSEILFQDKDMATFIAGFETANWDIDGYTYSGESELEENFVFKFEVKVNTSYIENIKVEFVDSRKEQANPFHTDYEYAFSRVGETVVTLPVTVNDAYDAIDGMMDKLVNARSYEMTSTTETNVPEAPSGTYTIKVDIVGDEYHVSRETADGIIVGRYEPATSERPEIFTVYLPSDNGYTSETVDYNAFMGDYFYGFATPHKLGTTNFIYADPVDEAYCLAENPTVTNEAVTIHEQTSNVNALYGYKMDANGLPTEIILQATLNDGEGHNYHTNITISFSHIGDTEVPMPHVPGNA